MKRVRKKGFDENWSHSEDKEPSHGRSMRKRERIWQRTMRRRLNREGDGEWKFYK